MATDDLDRERLSLERARLELESKRLEIEQGFFRRNLGAIITAAVTLIAVSVSGFQVWIAHIASEKEQRLAEIEAERRWRLDVFSIVSTHSDLIFSSDQNKQRQIRNVMLITLPTDIVSALFADLERTSAQAQVWSEGRGILQLGTVKPTFKEDCIRFNPSTTSVAEFNGRWKVIDGAHWMFDFGSAEDVARQALQIIAHYQMNESCFVGRPHPSFRYLLSSSRAPEGVFKGEECIRFNTDRIALNGEGGMWRIVEDDRVLFDFYEEIQEAQTAMQILQFYRFTHYCIVGIDARARFDYLRR
jgi:hypothetical protein